MADGGSLFLDAVKGGSTTRSTPAPAAANASRPARWSSRPGIDRRRRGRAIVGGVARPDRRRRRARETAERWAQVCTNSGKCIPACDYGVNPRFMVNMARIAAQGEEGDAEVRRAGASNISRR